VRAGYCSRLTTTYKSCKSTPPENCADVAAPPRRSIPPTPGEKARRIAELRAALADAAPLFQARIRREQEEGRS
jgi:hypothetical protein